MQAELGGDRGVGPAVGGGQDDLGADHVAVSGPGRVRPAGQLLCSSADKMITNGEEMIMVLLSRGQRGDAAPRRTAR